MQACYCSEDEILTAPPAEFAMHQSCCIENLLAGQPPECSAHNTQKLYLLPVIISSAIVSALPDIQYAITQRLVRQAWVSIAMACTPACYRDNFGLTSKSSGRWNNTFATDEDSRLGAAEPARVVLDIACCSTICLFMSRAALFCLDSAACKHK